MGTFERPFLLRPWPRSLVWGGHRLAERYKKGAPGQRIAESWELSDRIDGACSLVLGQEPETSELLSLHSLGPEDAPALLGAGVLQHGRGLPVLFKLIDASKRLSLQVHPGLHDLGHPALVGAESKEEAWLVIAAEPGAKIFLGLRPGTSRDSLRRALAEERVEELLHSFDARAGDVFHVRPGMFHAIGAGVLLAEVQQSSDTTYRVWDWGRMGDDGRPRALHVEQALTVGRFDSDHSPERVRVGRGVLPTESEDLVRGDGFQMDWRRAGVDELLDPGRDLGRFAVYCLLDVPASEHGVTIVDDRSALTLPVALGQSFLLPPGVDALVVSGAGSFLKVTVPE